MAREKWSSYLQFVKHQGKREEIFGKLCSWGAGPAKAAELCRKSKEGRHLRWTLLNKMEIT